MLCAGAYLTHSYARESSWESLCMFDKGEWHSSLDRIAHSQGSLISPEEQETWFSLALLPGRIHACPPWSPSSRSILHTPLRGWKSHRLFQASKQHVAALWLQWQRRVLPRDCSVPVRFYQSTAVPSYSWFIHCISQAAATPCGPGPFLFLCSRLKQFPHNLLLHLLPSALSTPVWSLVRVSRADTCSSVSLQLLLEVSRMLRLVRDGSKPHGECAGLCSRTLHSPILHRVTCFRG